jgi:hypothetical protein
MEDAAMGLGDIIRDETPQVCLHDRSLITHLIHLISGVAFELWLGIEHNTRPCHPFSTFRPLFCSEHATYDSVDTLRFLRLSQSSHSNECEPSHSSFRYQI